VHVRHEYIVDSRRLEAEAEHLTERAVCGVDHYAVRSGSGAGQPSISIIRRLPLD
jgi:hypothetical protein